MQFPGLAFGNILIFIQPSRGYDHDPAAVYHSPDLPPTPYYFGFYCALRYCFEAHAVIHLGKHGNLEWLPGKSVALSAACYPEAVLRRPAEHLSVHHQRPRRGHAGQAPHAPPSSSIT